MLKMKSRKCPICKKEIKGWNEAMVEWNLKVHLSKHKRDKGDKKNEEKD